MGLSSRTIKAFTSSIWKSNRSVRGTPWRASLILYEYTGIEGLVFRQVPEPSSTTERFVLPFCFTGKLNKVTLTTDLLDAVVGHRPEVPTSP